MYKVAVFHLDRIYKIRLKVKGLWQSELRIIRLLYLLFSEFYNSSLTSHSWLKAGKKCSRKVMQIFFSL